LMFGDLAALAGMKDPPGVVHQFQIIVEAEQDVSLRFALQTMNRHDGTQSCRQERLFLRMLQ
jgi:hypothetical protein